MSAEPREAASKGAPLEAAAQQPLPPSPYFARGMSLKTGLLCALWSLGALVLTTYAIVLDGVERFDPWIRSLGASDALQDAARASLALASLLPLVCCIPLVVWASRSFGAGRWCAWGVLLGGPFLNQEVLVPWPRIKSLELSKLGIELRPTSLASGLPSLLNFPQLFPVEVDRQEEVLSVLASRMGGSVDSQVFGARARLPHWIGLAILLLVPLFVFLPAAHEVVSRGWGEQPGLLHFSGAVMASVGLLGATLLALPTRFAVVEYFAGEGGLLCIGDSALILDEHAQVALAGRDLWVSSKLPTGGRVRRFCGLSSEEEALALREALVAGGVPVHDAVPRWARRGFLRLCAGLLVLASFAGGALPLAWAVFSPKQEVQVLRDGFGQQAVLTYELWDRQAQRLTLLPSGPSFAVEATNLQGPRGTHYLGGKGAALGSPGLRLENARGVWVDRESGAHGDLAPILSGQWARVTSSARFVPAGSAQELQGLTPGIRDGRLFYSSWIVGKTLGVPCANRTYRSLPALVEALLPDARGPLREFALGRTTRRFYDLEGSAEDGEDLIAAVSKGRVRWLVVLPKGEPFRLVGAEMGYGPDQARVLGPLPPGVSRARASGDLVSLRGHAPTLNEVLQARERLRAGASMDEVLTWALAQPGQE